MTASVDRAPETVATVDARPLAGPVDPAVTTAQIDPADRADAAQPTPTRHGATPGTRRSRRGLVALAALVAILAPVLLALAGGGRWWSYIAPEQTPMTWLQSVVLVVTGVVALQCAYLVGHHGEGRRAWGAWALLGAGFLALALDERFAIHERVRDRVLAPRDITIPFLPWVGPGDFLMLVVALCGLAALPLLWRAVAADRGARNAFLTGVLLAGMAVGMDSIDPATMSVAVERLEQTLEECVELAAALAFLTAAGLRFLSAAPAAARHTS